MDTHDRIQPDLPQADIASVGEGKSVIDSFGTIIFIVVLVEILLLIGLNLYQNSRIKSLTTKLGEHKTTLALPENRTINNQIDEVLAGQDQLLAALSAKLKWSKFYSLLNSTTPRSVKLTGLTVADGGTFKAEGTTSSLGDLARLVVAWTEGTDDIQTPFSSVVLNSNGFSNVNNSRVVTFSISGSVNLGLLQ